MSDKAREIADKYSHLSGPEAAYYSAKDAIESLQSELAALREENAKLKEQIEDAYYDARERDWRD